MQYLGSPNHPMPAHNYEAFNAVLRKKRRELVKQLERMKRFETTYTVVTKFMEEACLREAQSVDLFENNVCITVTLSAESVLDDFVGVALKLGAELKRARIHPTGSPMVSTDTFIAIRRTWTWYVNDSQRVSFNVNISENGCADYMVLKTVRHYPAEEYELVKRPNVIDVADLYTRIAGEVRFTREEVKVLAHGLGWNGDPAQLLSNLGYEWSEELIAEVLKVKELLHAEARSPTTPGQVRPEDVHDDVHQAHQAQAVLQPDVPGAGEGPLVPAPEATAGREDDQERETPR